MKRKIASFLNRLWYEGRPQGLVYLLWPLSFLYGLVVELRGFWVRRFISRPAFTVPIVVIGNITVGGTGKTPLTMALIALLQQKGLRVGVITRGYKSAAEYAAKPVLIEQKHTAAEVGDEARLIFQTMQVPIAVNHQRLKAVRALLAAHPDLEVILSDDGLQHLKLPRDLELVVVDAKRQFGNKYLLPAGPLREPLSRLHAVDFIVQRGVDFHLVPFQLEAMLAQTSMPLSFLSGKTVHAVAAIGHPEQFFASLRALGADLVVHVFPDHHCFTPADFADFDSELIVMTGKDATKCGGFTLPQAYILQIEVKINPVFEDAFWQKLRYIMRLKLTDRS